MGWGTSSERKDGKDGLHPFWDPEGIDKDYRGKVESRLRGLGWYSSSGSVSTVSDENILHSVDSGICRDPVDRTRVNQGVIPVPSVPPLP